MSEKTTRTTTSAIERNISAIHDLRVQSDENRRWDQRVVDHVAAFAGSASSIYAHLFFYGAWWLAGFISFHQIGKQIAPTQTEIGTVASLESIFLAVFVLINQRRMNSIARRHSDLQLQMTLLSENEITKIAGATSAIAKKLGIESQTISDLKEIEKDVRPKEIVDRLKRQEAQNPTPLTTDPEGTRRAPPEKNH